MVDVALDLDAYFRRIGWSGPRAPTLDVLAGLCLRHTASVPFENLDILLGRPIRLDLPSLVDKLVVQRRGGYCFEQNTLMQAVLEALGFRVIPFGARVRLGVEPGRVTARTHKLLRVDLDGQPYLVDVGFGLTPTAPLRFEAGLEQRLPITTYRLSREGTRWTLEFKKPEGYSPAYVFTEEPWFAIDDEVGNHYTSTHPRSHFMNGPMVVRHDPERGTQYALTGKEWNVRRGESIETHAIANTDEGLAVLSEVFGLSFPPGTRFRGME
jgi:N-hydroxyarylamine O-acetyltransferase